MHLKLLFVSFLLIGTVFCDLNRDIIENLGKCQKLNPCPELINGLLNMKIWAIKMVDASSKIPNGLFSGNIMDFGNFDECMAIENKTDNIRAQYCGFSLIITVKVEKKPSKAIGVFMNHEKVQEIVSIDSDGVPLVLSLCLPDTCSPFDFKECAELLVADFEGVTVSFQDTMCQTNKTPEIDKYDIVTIVLFSIICLLVVLCTTYDVIIHKLEKKPHHILLVSFSLLTNGKKLISIQNNPDQLTCLNGMRFMSMMWVLVGHRYSSTQALPSLNRLYIDEWRGKVYSQYIQGAPLAVDTFLCISGLVLSYSFLKTYSRPKSRFNIILFYIHRYLRLTPAVAALFFFVISIIKFLGTGPLWPFLVPYLKDSCTKYWWSYFLYVQNYVNMNDICLLHTWYLSMDMQIFLISPIVLLPLLKFKKHAMYALYGLVVVFIIIPFVITYIYETEMFTQDYYDYYYYLTHTRMAPWIIGIIMGSIVLDWKSREFKIHWATNLGIWLAVLCGMGAIVFTGNDILNNFEVLKNAFYLALHRAAWSVGLCWIIFACLKDYGGIINWFLSLPLFQVLARLTYSMYLVHVVLIMIQIGRQRTPVYISDYDMFYTFSGDLFMTIIVATFWTLFFESPLIVIEKFIFGGGSNKKNANDLNDVKVSTTQLIEEPAVETKTNL